MTELARSSTRACGIGVSMERRRWLRSKRNVRKLKPNCLCYGTKCSACRIRGSSCARAWWHSTRNCST